MQIHPCALRKDPLLLGVPLDENPSAYKSCVGEGDHSQYQKLQGKSLLGKELVF